MIINIPNTINYLSEFITDLPHNCLFSKGKVGAGGTSVALTNNEHYIIAVPYIALIESKINQHENILGIYGKTKNEDIKKYLLNTKILYKKIMVTFDSLPKLLEYIDPKDYRLLIDEYHLLFTAYSYRRDACLSVLSNYDKFKSYCFMTATPLEPEFTLTQLSNLPVIEYEWNNVAEVTVHSLYCKNNVIPTVCDIIYKYMNGEIQGNPYFFVNSVEFIKEIVRLCNLNDDNARAIYSDYNKTQVGIANSKVCSEPKIINFITSKAFEGADIYDKDGRIYIVSDKTKANTLLDISTQINQIGGRIRDTQYWNQITHIYSSTRYINNSSYTEFKSIVNALIEETTATIDGYNKFSDIEKKRYKPTDETYLYNNNGIYEFDENAVKIDLFNYKVTKCLYKYKINLTKEYQKNNYNVINHTSVVKNPYKKSNNFKDVVIGLQNNTEDIDMAYTKYPFLKDAINLLGYERMQKMNYNQTNIKTELLKQIYIPDNVKIKELLKSYVNIGEFIPNSTIKTIMIKIYETLNIKLKVSATIIQDYYITKITKYNNVHGHRIIKEK